MLTLYAIEADSCQPVLPIRPVSGGGREDSMLLPYCVILGIFGAFLRCDTDSLHRASRRNKEMT
jgi:hypothetical protein